MQGHEKLSSPVKGSFHKAFSGEAPGDKLSDTVLATKSFAISSFSIRIPCQP
jgi:hypothetical protein